MGLKPIEVKRLTLKEFNLMLTGYIARQDREWNRTRHLMSYIASYAGMGATSFVKPQDIWPLPLDKKEINKNIKTLKQAIELLNEFEAKCQD